MLQAKSKAKLMPSSTVVVSNASVSSSSVPAIVTSAITTQALHAGQGIHQAAASSQQQQSHNVVAQHLPILMDPLVPSNYLISI